MTMSAFHGSEEVRATLLARLQQHAASGRLKPGPLAWNGEGGSLVGCMIENDDLTTWEARSGLPAWLAVAGDGLAGMLPDRAEALAFGERLLAAIAPGSDLQGAGSLLLARLIGEMAARFPATLITPALAQAVAQVNALHGAVATGVETAPADWKAARRLAVQATDALQDPAQLALAQCVETAAWNPVRSSACVYDTMRVWKGALNEQAIREFGWTDVDDKDMELTLRHLDQTYLLPAPHLKLTVFDLLEEHYPEKALRLRDYYRHQRESGAKTTQRATDMLFGVLAQSGNVDRD
nr:hypothetical protein [uncultured Duganella sp.]